MNVLNRLQPVGLLVLRVVAGLILMAHGKAKVFGGMHAHMAMVHSLGMPAWMAYLSAGTEFVGGALLIVGLLVRLVGLAVCIEMCVALTKVHWPHGDRLGSAAGFPALMGATGFLLICFGGGLIGLDGLLWGGRGGKKRMSSR